MFDTEMLTLCEHVMAQVCADFEATSAEFNGEEDHVHLLVQYPPKVALSHLVNSLKDVSSRRLRQDFFGRSTRLRCADGSGPRHTSLDHAVAHHCPPSRPTSPTRNDQTRQGFLPALKDRVPTPKHLMTLRIDPGEAVVMVGPDASSSALARITVTK